MSQINRIVLFFVDIAFRSYLLVLQGFAALKRWWNY